MLVLYHTCKLVFDPRSDSFRERECKESLRERECKESLRERECKESLREDQAARPPEHVFPKERLVICAKGLREVADDRRGLLLLVPHPLEKLRSEWLGHGPRFWAGGVRTPPPRTKI